MNTCSHCHKGKGAQTPIRNMTIHFKIGVHSLKLPSVSLAVDVVTISQPCPILPSESTPKTCTKYNWLVTEQNCRWILPTRSPSTAEKSHGRTRSPSLIGSWEINTEILINKTRTSVIFTVTVNNNLP